MGGKRKRSAANGKSLGLIFLILLCVLFLAGPNSALAESPLDTLSFDLSIILRIAASESV